jgi:hypothetical protein
MLLCLRVKERYEGRALEQSLEAAWELRWPGVEMTAERYQGIA